MAVEPIRENTTSGTRYDFDAFIKDVEWLIANESDAKSIAFRVENLLVKLLKTENLLTPDQRTSRPDRYCPNLIAIAPSRQFSIVALVWRPGQMTPIHDHISWCVVGVYEGEELEQNYRLLEGEHGEQWLYPDGTNRMSKGMTAALIPPDENIHQVSNIGDDVAISIHIYGADLSAIRSGNSINRSFNNLQKLDNPNGKCVPWRKTEKDMFHSPCSEPWMFDI